MIVRYGLARERIGLIVVATIMLIVSAVRQPIYFLGLDVPHPQSHFSEREWELVAVANLTLMAWVSVILVAYVFGAWPARFISLFFPSRMIGQQRETWNLGVFMVVVAPFALSILGTIILLNEHGGFAGLTYASKVGKELKGLFAIRAAGSLASVLALYGLLTSMRTGSDGRLRMSPMGWVYLGMVLLAMTSNFAWGNRYSIALILLGFLTTVHFYLRRFRLWEVLALGLFFATVLQGLKLLRFDLLSEVAGKDVSVLEGFWLTISLSLHFAEFDAFMLALRDTGSLFDFRAGQDFINGLLSWVPRSILPAKESFHIGPWFRQIYEPWTINGWPVTTAGSWYVNFGPIGIVLGGGLAGLFLRAYDMAFDKVRTNPWHAAIGPGLAFFLFEGGVSTGFLQFYVLYAVPLYLALFWVVMGSARKSRVQAMRTGRGQTPVLSWQ